MKKREFIKFYDQYAPRVYRFIYLKVNSSQDSEDLTSEAFLKFWRNIILDNKQQNSQSPVLPQEKEKTEDNKKIDNPRALLYRIANNLVIDFYRKKSRTELITNPEEGSPLAKIPDKTDLNKGIDLNSDMIEVKKALDQLKGEYQDVIVWHYLDDLSAKEIAQITGKSEGTIRVSIHRALGMLKNKLKNK